MSRFKVQCSNKQVLKEQCHPLVGLGSRSSPFGRRATFACLPIDGLQKMYNSMNLTIYYNFFLTVLTGEDKLGKVICPDKWKDGARNTLGLESLVLIKGLATYICFRDWREKAEREQVVVQSSSRQV